MDYLKSQKINDLFLVPQINWEPKSKNIRRIAELLNIGIDSIAFFDDSINERNEVKSNAPMVRVYDILDLKEAIKTDPFDVPISDETKNRKKQYVENIKRNDEIEKNGGDIITFLKNANMKLTISKGNLENIDRYYEIVQRTNQLNVSVRRLTLEQIKDFINSQYHDFIELRLSDKYGDYGIIGVCNVSLEDFVIEDMLFSCRAAMKYVEENFIKWLMTKYPSNKLKIKFRITDRNKKIIDKIKFAGFVEDGDYLVEDFKLAKNFILPFDIYIEDKF